MISGRDVWAALLTVKRYGDGAMLEAAARADELLEAGTSPVVICGQISGALSRRLTALVS